MVEKTRGLDFLTYLFLILGVLVLCFPIYYLVVASSHSLEDVLKIPMSLIPGSHFTENILKALETDNLGRQLLNSLIVSLGISFGKISISLLSAFAITYFDFKIRKLVFWSIFFTLMLPIEVRILPTYEVISNVFTPFMGILQFFNISVDLNWSMLDSYPGLILPLIASATATFLFRQFFLTIPNELCEASKIDGATPMMFFRKVLFPLSKSNMASLFVIVFVFSWNQYLWPLLITTKPEMKTAIIGLQSIIPKTDETPMWNTAMAASLLVMLPPILVVVFMQRWFVKGLVEKEK